MRNILFALFVTVASAVSFVSCAQSDREYIFYAKNALSLMGNCDDALRFLDKVSADGRLTPDYFLCRARAHDCKSDDAQAIYYYNKYLERNPVNDSVKKRIAELTDQKAHQEHVPRVVSEKASGSEKTKRRNINTSYLLMGLSCDFATGGEDAPYKNAITAHFSGNYLVVHRRMTLGYALNSGLLISQNAGWFSSAFRQPSAAVAGLGIGLAETALFLPMAIIVNRRGMALTAGPEFGFGFVDMPSGSDTYGSATIADDGHAFGLCYGLRSDLLIGLNFAFFAEYATGNMKSVTTEYAGVSQSMPVSHDMFRIGICARLNTWRLGWWW